MLFQIFYHNVTDHEIGNEFVYSGDLNRDGQPHCERVIMKKNNITYEGKFRNGLRSGFGILTKESMIIDDRWENDSLQEKQVKIEIFFQIFLKKKNRQSRVKQGFVVREMLNL